MALQVPKETKGEHFKDLDLLTKLLDIKPSHDIKCSQFKAGLIQDMSLSSVDDDFEDFDWNLPQSLPSNV